MFCCHWFFCLEFKDKSEDFAVSCFTQMAFPLSSRNFHHLGKLHLHVNGAMLLARWLVMTKRGHSAAARFYFYTFECLHYQKALKWRELEVPLWPQSRTSPASRRLWRWSCPWWAAASSRGCPRGSWSALDPTRSSTWQIPPSASSTSLAPPSLCPGWWGRWGFCCPRCSQCCFWRGWRRKQEHIRQKVDPTTGWGVFSMTSSCWDGTWESC